MAEETKREKFRIGITKHLPFPKQSENYFSKSTDLCKLFSDVFRQVYSDWEGCTFEMNGKLGPSINMFFNQRQAYDENRVPATSMVRGKKSSSNPVLDNRRSLDQQSTFGDRFFLTEDGEDGLEQFVFSQYINQKTGKVNWGAIVAPVSPNQNTQGYAMNAYTRTQFTKVSCLDPKKILAAIYGDTDENGDPIEYGVTMTKNLGGNNGFPQISNVNPGFLLRIDRFDHKRLQEVGQTTLGYMISDDGLGIIR